MKALLKENPGPGFTWAEVPMPSCKPDEVLIKVKTNGICGTDLHIYHWDDWAARTIQTPLIVGHEFMGEIVSVGEGIAHLKPKDRVSGEGHLTCGLCRNCRDGKRHLCLYVKGLGIQCNGAFAEYLCLPAVNVVKIPDDIPDNIAAILDPLGNAVHTALSFDLTGEDVLITGAGPIGLMATAIAAFVGAKRIVVSDCSDFRLKLASHMGATHTINVEKQTLTEGLNNLNLPFEFTVGLEMSGSLDAIHDQLEWVYPGGALGLLGIPSKPVTLNWDKIIFKGLTLKGIYGRKLFSTWQKMTELLEAGLAIAPIITHHFKIQDFKQAFEMPAESAGKILLHWE